MVKEDKERQAKIDALVKRLDNMSDKDWEAEHKKNVQVWIQNSLTKTVPLKKDWRDNLGVYLMQVLTNLHGQDSKSTAQRVQNMVTEIATKQLGFNEMGLYFYNVSTDSPDKLSGRLDGIISSLSMGDVVILQTPTWNGVAYENRLLDKFRGYRGVKVVAFIHDMVPWMFEGSAGMLTDYIKLYNRCDLVISPIEKMTARLRKHGLTVKKVINQDFWDHPVAVDTAMLPPFNRVVNFIAGVRSLISWKIGRLRMWSSS